ncbi:MAG: EF-P beta-lysylation protein EpmB [Gammaproteobacteria bacterium]|nr:EF-P beta-lysylation protein EpmB [Gammaproteobacteria bacterium]
MVAPIPGRSQPANNSEGSNWKAEQAAAIRDPEELFRLLSLDLADLPAARTAATQFPLRLPRALLDCIEPGNPADPVLRQFLPLGKELDTVAGYSRDPLAETAAQAGPQATPGLLQKYSGRALLTLTGACGVHCRYCFRRHFDYTDANPLADWPAIRQAIAADKGIEEVILSGGDPLLLGTDKLRRVSTELAALPHLRRLRIHSRQPVVLPSRVDDELLDWLTGLPLDTVLVLHVNHPAELGTRAREALRRLRQTGITLLNQSVLLGGVNDSADTLCELSEALFANGVLPYYLHVLDKVEGAAHFDLPESRARLLWNQVHARLSGYLVPRLVREIPEASGKILL